MKFLGQLFVLEVCIIDIIDRSQYLFIFLGASNEFFAANDPICADLLLRLLHFCCGSQMQ